MSRRNNLNMTRTGVIAGFYMLLIVVAIICAVILYNGPKPGVYYSCDSKIPATIKAGFTVDFYKNGDFEPAAIPGSRLYIIWADETTCSLVYEGYDAQHSAIARDVPLSYLQYDENQIGAVRKIHNCRSEFVSNDNNKEINMIVSVLLISILVFLAVRVLVLIISKTVLSRRER